MLVQHFMKTAGPTIHEKYWKSIGYITSIFITHPFMYPLLIIHLQSTISINYNEKECCGRRLSQPPVRAGSVPRGAPPTVVPEAREEEDTQPIFWEKKVEEKLLVPRLLKKAEKCRKTC
jgi:hypothetical protein